MATETAIAWTDHTFNTHWGCTKVEAPGDEPSECDNCYAETLAIRFGFSETGSKPALWGPDAQRRRLSDAYWKAPLVWNANAAEHGRQELVFCSSMADVFEARDDLDDVRARLFDLIAQTPNLIWQLLTKRPEHVAKLVPPAWMAPHPWRTDRANGWPPNVWIGTSVGTQRSAKIRVPRLLELPAPVRFLSCEPLLGPVNLDPWLWKPWDGEVPGWALNDGCPSDGAVTRVRPGIDWVIIGGESGPHYRAMDPTWAVNLYKQTQINAKVPTFFKQIGGLWATQGGDELVWGNGNMRAGKNFPPEAGDRSWAQSEVPVQVTGVSS